MKKTKWYSAGCSFAVIAWLCCIPVLTFSQVDVMAVKKTGNILYNAIDKNTGEMVSFVKTATYWDGTPMKPAYCDGIVYIIYKKEYYKRSYTGEANIKWFGCTEKNKANDTIINKILSRYHSAFIPAGVYTFSHTIVLPATSVLSGEGNGSVLKLLSAVPVTGISVGRAVVVKNLQLDCTQTDMDTEAAISIKGWPGVETQLEEIKMQGLLIKGNYPRLQGIGLQLSVKTDAAEKYSIINFCNFFDINIHGFRDGIVCSADYTKGSSIIYINANNFQNVTLNKCLRPVSLLNTAAAEDITSGKSAIANNTFSNITVQHVVENYPAFYIDGGTNNKVDAQIIDWTGNYAETTKKSAGNNFNLLPDNPGKLKRMN